MASEDTSISPVIMRKSKTARNHRGHNRRRSMEKNLMDDGRINRIVTARNQSVSKSSVILTKTEPVQFKRCHSQQREILTAKLERQSTNIPFQTRLPTFHTLTRDDDQKKTADFRRRQIYALNHLMRNLEQEQFRQFCELYNVGTDKNGQSTNTSEDTDKESSAT